VSIGAGARPRRALGCGALIAATVLLGGCGGQSAPVPSDIVQSYETALAQGNYSGACGELDPGARAALARRLGPRASCAKAVARCLPYKATIPKQDQSQLLFGNLLVSEHGSHASVSLNGNPVANEIRQVSLVNKRKKGWMLTSYGRGFNACHRPRRSGRRQA
jgi:hypothetical protein